MPEQVHPPGAIMHRTSKKSGVKAVKRRCVLGIAISGQRWGAMSARARPRSSTTLGCFLRNLTKPPAVAWVANVHTQQPGDLFR